jgi:flavin-binding protein dodecin
MAEGGQRPDSFTFSAIFNACQRAEEAELALDVARVMKLRGVRMDETHAVILLRICYNRLRQSWVPGGYPPNRASAPVAVANLPGSRRSHECQRLLEVRGRASATAAAASNALIGYLRVWLPCMHVSGHSTHSSVKRTAHDVSSPIPLCRR